MSTVLYEKNGVITEERFKKLTVVQWMFHYLEIMKHKNEDIKFDMDMLNSIIKSNISVITADIELLGVIIDKDNGLKMIEIKQKARDKAKKEQLENTGEKTNKESVKTDISKAEIGSDLSDADKEAWAFFMGAPETKAPTKEQDQSDKFCLPTVDIKKKMSAGFETKIEDDKQVSFNGVNLKNK